MTIHYPNKKIEDITAEEIVEGWIYHGRSTPSCFVILNETDNMAFNCWRYLQMNKHSKMSIRKFCLTIKDETFRKKFRKLLKKVVMFVEKPPEDLAKKIEEIDKAKQERIRERLKDGVKAYIMKELDDYDLDKFREYRYLVIMGTNSEREVDEMIENKKEILSIDLHDE